jgi:O-antigen ligase
MKMPYPAIGFLVLTAVGLTGFDLRTGLTFALVCLYFAALAVHLESGIYIILAAAVIFIDGWAPERSPEDVVFRLGLGRVYIMEIAVYGLLSIYSLKRILGWIPRSQRTLSSSTPLDRPIIAFAALLPAFAFFGLLRGNPLQDAIGYFEWRCLFLSIVFFFLLVTLADTHAKAMRYFWWFMSLVAAKASYSLIIYVLGIRGPFPEVFGSGPVDEGPENYMFVFAALVAVSLLLFARELSKGKLALVWLTVVVGVVNVLVSEKRNPQLGLVVGLIVVVSRLKFKQLLKAGFTTALAILAYLACTSVLGMNKESQAIGASSSRYEEVVQFIREPQPQQLLNLDGTLAFHLLDFVDGWNTVKQRPILGYGFGGQLQREFTLLPNVGGEFVTLGMVHDQYLTFWLKMGLVGLFCYLWLFFSLLRFGSSSIPRISSTLERAVVLGFYSALWGDLAMEMWGPSWIGNTKFPLIIFLSVGLIIRLSLSCPRAVDTAVEGIKC